MAIQPSTTALAERVRARAEGSAVSACRAAIHSAIIPQENKKFPASHRRRHSARLSRPDRLDCLFQASLTPLTPFLAHCIYNNRTSWYFLGIRQKRRTNVSSHQLLILLQFRSAGVVNLSHLSVLIETYPQKVESEFMQDALRVRASVDGSSSFRSPNVARNESAAAK